MKKFSILIVLCINAFYSCKKDNHVKTQVTQKTYTVKFSVTGFSQSLIPFQTNSIKSHTLSADSLKNNVSILYYLVYKDDVRIRKITQNSADPDFGTITDSFSTADDANGNPPTYRIIVIAGQNGLTDANNADNPNASADIFGYVSNGQSQFFGDTFYTSISFEVPDSSYALSLERVVSQLKINIQDVIPANAKQIAVTFSDYQALLASTALADPNLPPIQRTILTNVTPGAINTSISTILLNTEITFSVEIKCTDAYNNVIADKNVTGVSCKANETTILTGDLFTLPGTGFNVTYDPTWGTPTQINFN